MKSFPANFSLESAKKTGITPVWVLKLTVSSVAYYLADDAHVIAGWNGGVTCKPWIEQWGQVREAAGVGLREVTIADFSVTCLVDPDVTPNMETLATASDLEKTPAELYLWFRGLNASTDPPQLMLRGYVKDPVELPDPLHVRLTIEDEATRLLQRYLGTRIDLATYPNADPDDVGKILPLPYGTVRVPAVGIKCGAATTLVSAITAAGSNLTVVDASGIAVNDVLLVDAEKILVGAVSGNTCSSLTRGYSGTVAASHVAGAPTYEVLSGSFVYCCSGRALTSVDRVICRDGDLDVDVTDQCTRYANGATIDGVNYSGLGLIAITSAQADAIRARIQVARADVTQGSHGHAMTTQTLVVNPDDWGMSGSGLDWYLDLIIDKDLTTNRVFHGSAYKKGRLYRKMPVSAGGTPIRVRAVAVAGDPAYTDSCDFVAYLAGNAIGTLQSVGGSTKTTYYTAWRNFTSWADLIATNTYIEFGGGFSNTNVALFEAWFEVEYNPSPPDGPATGVARTGTINSVADAAIGGVLLAEVTAPTTTPLGVVTDLLSRAGIGSCAQVGLLPGSYAVKGALLDYRRAADVLQDLVWQCRCVLRVANGAGRLLARPDSLASALTLPAVRLEDGVRVHARRKSSSDEVINKIQLLYNRDFTLSGDSAYRSISAASDATSIADYGECERPDLFKCDWIASSAMAADVRDFYLGRYRRRRWLHQFDVFLDCAAIEFFDAVTLGFAAGTPVGQVIEVQFAPGDLMRMDTVGLVVEV